MLPWYITHWPTYVESKMQIDWTLEMTMNMPFLSRHPSVAEPSSDVHLDGYLLHSTSQGTSYLTTRMHTHNTGLALADRQFVISERISQMTKGNVTAFVNLTKALKRLKVLECSRN